MPIRLMNNPWLLLCVSALTVTGAYGATESDDTSPEADFALVSKVPMELPEVLSATRLRQPRAEVPASMTVIDAARIQAWGVRTLPELMRFVPGMFIGHGDDENNASVAYHASSPNVMRRLQVLVDGRSVYRAGIASVIWDDIPVAMEDIQRIEVVRGPNSASWGANAFLGVINIVTRHPADTVGTRLRYRNGNQGIDDAFASHSWGDDESAWRISSELRADDGFDGRYSGIDGEDNWRDSRRHGFISLNRDQILDNGWHLSARSALKRGHTDIRQESYDLYPADQDTDQGFISGQLDADLGTGHSLMIRGYWQYDHRRVKSRSCALAAGFDPVLFDLYRENPDLVNLAVMGLAARVKTPEVAAVVTGIASGTVTVGDFESYLSARNLDIAVTDHQLEQLGGVFARAYNGIDFSSLDDVVCGRGDRSLYEERLDLEIEDTRVWNDRLRTVAGVGVRRDQVNSLTYFDGVINNDTWRMFGNLEWRPQSWLLMNAGGTLDHEGVNGRAFSPRVATNVLMTDNSSIRLVYSEAVRSPDLLEQSPEYSIRLASLSPNYLGLENGRYYMNQWPASRNLEREKIVSRELGYYGRMSGPDIEIDVKIYQDRLSNLISEGIALNTVALASDSRMKVDGAEIQLNWQVNARHRLWLVAAHVEAEVTPGNTNGLSTAEVEAKRQVELRLAPTSSLVTSWSYRRRNWEISSSYFIYDAYNEFNAQPNRYRRCELNLRGNLGVGRYTPWAGVHVQHLINSDALVYVNQRYADRYIGYFQIGLNF